MKSELLAKVQKDLKDESAVRGMIQFFVWVIIIAVVAFCEIMYVKIMLIGFPDGLIRAVAIAGAIATGMSVLALYAGKNHWFSKGPQTWAAWLFTGVEICILILNVILAFNFHEPSLDFWKQAYPAAPIVALIGWGIVLYLDRQNIMRRRQREMQEEQHEAELQYEHLVHNTRMAVKSNSLEIVAGKLEAKLESSEAHAALEAIANQIYHNILGEISGRHVPQLPQPQTTVQPVSLSQSGTFIPPQKRLTPEEQQAQIEAARANYTPEQSPPLTVADVERMTQLPHSAMFHLENVLGKENYQKVLARLAGNSTSPLAEAPTDQQNGANHQ